MTEAEIEQELEELKTQLAELRGEVKTLTNIFINRSAELKNGIDKTNSIKTVIQFVAVVIVPLLVTLIGGYFALKTGTK